MYRYLLEQEQILLRALEKEEELQKIYEYSKTQIAWLSHERLVHLIVTLFFGGLLSASFIGVFFLQNGYIYIVFIILTILVLFYIIHYYRLENGVQRLYRISNQLYDKINHPM